MFDYSITGRGEATAWVNGAEGDQFQVAIEFLYETDEEPGSGWTTHHVEIERVTSGGEKFIIGIQAESEAAAAILDIYPDWLKSEGEANHEYDGEGE